MMTYKNKGDVQIIPTRTFEQDGGRESRLTCGTHTGTHVDAPAHFLQNGKTLDQMDLSQLIGKCQVVDMMHITEKITAQDLDQVEFEGCKIVLFKTRNSSWLSTDKFDPDFVYLDASGAQFLAKMNLAQKNLAQKNLAQINLGVVGIDSLGIERGQPEHDTHQVLFKKDILIIEGLRLINVDPGIYNLICLPINIIGADGALARAILTI